MRKTLVRLLLAMPLCGSVSCVAEPPTAAQAQALSGFTFDSRDIGTPPPVTLPANPLPLSAFDDAIIARALIQTAETFAPGERSADVVEMVSPSWKFEKLQSRGAMLVMKTAPTGPPAPQDEALLQRQAIDRLQGWGVPADEIGRVLQRRGMQQDRDERALHAPEIHRYKTFVFRAINGVEVQGHRATLSHATDGSFHRALLQWPALSAAGHRLTTRLSVTEIEQRAARALTAEGESDGAVRLRWKYDAEALPSGEVTLKLKVGARMVAVHNGDYTEEPREISVPVDAM